MPRKLPWAQESSTAKSRPTRSAVETKSSNSKVRDSRPKTVTHEGPLMVPGLAFDDQYVMTDIEFEAMAGYFAEDHHKSVYKRMREEEDAESMLKAKLESPRVVKRYDKFTESEKMTRVVASSEEEPTEKVMYTTGNNAVLENTCVDATDTVPGASAKKQKARSQISKPIDDDFAFLFEVPYKANHNAGESLIKAKTSLREQLGFQ